MPKKYCIVKMKTFNLLFLFFVVVRTASLTNNFADAVDELIESEELIALIDYIIDVNYGYQYGTFTKRDQPEADF